MKKNEDLFGMKSFVIDSAEDVVAHLPCLRDDSYFCQVYVDGASEITTHILMYRGEIIYHCNVVYEMMSGPYVRGERASPKSHVINHDQWHLSLFRSILNSIGFRDGICCMNYKLQDGVPKIFEINPRFGGSLCLDINRFLEAYIGALRQR